MSNYSDALFHANREVDEWKERYDELAKRCAAAEAQLAAVNDYLREAGIGLAGKDGVETLDGYLQMHRQDALRLSAQAKAAGELLRGLLAACEAKDSLLACYRLGKQPSEALFKKLDKAKAAIEAAERAGVKP